MASGKVVVNLATGLEDPERVTVAFLVGTAVLEQGRQVTIVPDQGGSALGLPGHAEAVACDGCFHDSDTVHRRRRRAARLPHLLQRP